MNPEAQEVLNGILQKDPSNLTRIEREFLRARAGYLKKSQAEEYAEVLEGTEAPLEPTPGPEAATPDHLKVPQLPYNELLNKARELGFRGPRVARSKLDAFIKEKETE